MNHLTSYYTDIFQKIETEYTSILAIKQTIEVSYNDTLHLEYVKLINYMNSLENSLLNYQESSSPQLRSLSSMDLIRNLVISTIAREKERLKTHLSISNEKSLSSELQIDLSSYAAGARILNVAPYTTKATLLPPVESLPPAATTTLSYYIQFISFILNNKIFPKIDQMVFSGDPRVLLKRDAKHTALLPSPNDCFAIKGARGNVTITFGVDADGYNRKVLLQSIRLLYVPHLSQDDGQDGSCYPPAAVDLIGWNKVPATASGGSISDGVKSIITGDKSGIRDKLQYKQEGGSVQDMEPPMQLGRYALFNDLEEKNIVKILDKGYNFSEFKEQLMNGIEAVTVSLESNAGESSFTCLHRIILYGQYLHSNP